MLTSAFSECLLTDPCIQSSRWPIYLTYTPKPTCSLSCDNIKTCLHRINKTDLNQLSSVKSRQCERALTFRAIEYRSTVALIDLHRSEVLVCWCVYYAIKFYAQNRDVNSIDDEKRHRRLQNQRPGGVAESSAMGATIPYLACYISLLVYARVLSRVECKSQRAETRDPKARDRVWCSQESRMPANGCFLSRKVPNRYCVGYESPIGDPTFQRSKFYTSRNYHMENISWESFHRISTEDVFHGNFTWAKTYENSMETRRIPC